ncbi:DJ-1/PfpI family protein [Vibrio porteresiae]|uniref:DJ-1/PfpI family protein n=1 Tax=Vibrio porteresiae DSM 19223 TaxID=1123496 RepID=A0ABZ0QJF4_9VIBR|nr:DJ-1/PfpI family protein [Vibrio porteresiae]WPC75832.1 DJ-1/PfpI family protein [Vibrio porteresiae DSM 19223]
MNIGIYVYENSEVLDFSGPFEVFCTAKRLGADQWNVFTVGQTLEPISARGGFKHVPMYSFADHPPIDVLVVVGGVHHDEMDKEPVIEWIRQVAKTATWVTSVCTGAFLLARAGLLTGKRVTTHWEDIPALHDTFAELTVVPNVRWVRDGQLVTSAGISAGIDMSLWLVSELGTLTLAEETAIQMDYAWENAPQDDQFGVESV